MIKYRPENSWTKASILKRLEGVTEPSLASFLPLTFGEDRPTDLAYFKERPELAFFLPLPAQAMTELFASKDPVGFVQKRVIDWVGVS